jgi:hypothetical protein
LISNELNLLSLSLCTSTFTWIPLSNLAFTTLRDKCLYHIWTMCRNTSCEATCLMNLALILNLPIMPFQVDVINGVAWLLFLYLAFLLRVVSWNHALIVLKIKVHQNIFFKFLSWWLQGSFENLIFAFSKILVYLTMLSLINVLFLNSFILSLAILHHNSTFHLSLHSVLTLNH